MPFARKDRFAESTVDIDQMEMTWWNKNADLIEVVWGLPEKLTQLCRAPYLLKIRPYFLAGKPANQEIKVLELACGSGWPGRILASKQIRIVGVDFSEEQIKLASQNSAGKNCIYRTHDLNDMSGLLKSQDFDGIFVHCALHHLSGKELEKFADQISQSKAGTKLVFVEPVYHDRALTMLAPLRKALRLLMKLSFKYVQSKNPIDQALSAKIEIMNTESEKNGWFLSPKEVPLNRDEIQKLFGSRFKIEKLEPVTHYGQQFAQNLALLSDQPAAQESAKFWVPFFNLLDSVLISTGLLPIIEKDYLYSAILMTKK